MKTYKPERLKDNGSPIILVDFSWVMYNSYYASNENAEDAVRLFTERIFTLRNSYPTSAMILVMDSPTGTSFRKQLYPDYKGDRKHPEGVFKYLKEIMQIVSLAQNIFFVQDSEWESDDLIYTLHNLYKDYSGGIMIFSQDQDFLPLISKTTTIFHTVKKQMAVPVTRQEAEKRLKYAPDLMDEIKIICGDAHNNVKGIPYFRKKVASEIIRACREKGFSMSQVFLNDSTLHQLPFNLQKPIMTVKEKYPDQVQGITMREQLIPLRLVEGITVIKIKGKKDTYDRFFI